MRKLLVKPLFVLGELTLVQEVKALGAHERVANTWIGVQCIMFNLGELVGMQPPFKGPERDIRMGCLPFVAVECRLGLAKLLELSNESQLLEVSKASPRFVFLSNVTDLLLVGWRGRVVGLPPLEDVCFGLGRTLRGKF